MTGCVVRAKPQFPGIVRKPWRLGGVGPEEVALAGVVVDPDIVTRARSHARYNIIPKQAHCAQ